MSRLGTIIPEHVHICFKSWKLFFGLKIPCWKNSSLLLASFALRTYTVHEYVIATVWLSCHEPCLVCTGIAKISRIVLQYLSPTPCKYKSISVFFLGTVKNKNKKKTIGGVCGKVKHFVCNISRFSSYLKIPCSLAFDYKCASGHLWAETPLFHFGVQKIMLHHFFTHLEVDPDSFVTKKKEKKDIFIFIIWQVSVALRYEVTVVTLQCISSHPLWCLSSWLTLNWCFYCVCDNTGEMSWVYDFINFVF